VDKSRGGRWTWGEGVYISSGYTFLTNFKRFTRYSKTIKKTFSYTSIIECAKFNKFMKLYNYL